MTLTRSQEAILCVILFNSASLSIFGSSCITYQVLSSRKEKPLTPYRRIMLGMSLCDIINSTFMPLQAILVPKGSSDHHWASGNDATCSALGFFLQFGFSVAFYNGMLSFYYLFTIRLGFTQKRVERWEPFMHGISILYPLLTAVVGLALGAYHELDLGSGCWLSDYPEGCQIDPDKRCESDRLAWIFAGVPVVSSFFFILINNLLIYLRVKKILSRGMRHSIEQRSSLHSSALGDRQARRKRAVAVQAFLYVAAYFFTMTWAVIVRILESNRPKEEEETGTFFPLLVLTNMFTPLQGFFNLFVYSRPRFLRFCEENPDKSRLWALNRTVFGEACAQKCILHVKKQSSRSQTLESLDVREPTEPVSFLTTPLVVQSTSDSSLESSLTFDDSKSTITWSNVPSA